MNLKCLAAALALILALPAAGSADEAWTLEAALDYALAHNPDLAVYEAQIDVAAETRAAAFGNFLPQLYLEGGYSYLGSVPTIEINIPLPDEIPIDLPGMSFEMGAHDNYKADFYVNQLVFGSGRAYYGHRATGWQLEAKRCERDVAQLKVARFTAEAFLGVQISQEALQARRQALEAAQRHLKQVTDRYNAGAASGFELLRAQVETANREPEVQAALEQSELAKAGFRRALGLAEDAPVQVAGGLQDEPRSVDEPAALQAALSGRPEFALVDAGRQAYSDLARSRRGEMLPALVFNGSYGWQKPYYFDRDGALNYSLGFGLRVPLFDGLRAWHNAGESRARAQAMLSSRGQLEADVSNEVRIAALGWSEAALRVQSTADNVARAERMVQGAEQSYTAGAVTSLEVLDAQLALTNARLLHLKAQYDYRLAQVRLAAASGDIEAIRRLSR